MLSILIVNWNTKDLLRVCLKSIDAFPPSCDYEIIVVDNFSKDGSSEMVRAEFPRVQLVASTVNTGYAKGNNIAFSRANGDWLLTLNPDTEFVDQSLDAALEHLAANPGAGALGIKQVSVDGDIQQSVRGFPTVIGILGDMTGLGARYGGRLDSYRLTRFDYTCEQPAPQPMGTFLLFRKAALASIGSTAAPFDEAFPIFFNEVDLLYRLASNGWECLYTPKAKIKHHGGESTKQVRSSMIWEGHRSLARYLWKHHGNGLGVVGLPFVTLAIYVAAFARAKGYHAGFRA
ncbi:MAG: glycosyltransferase family 2 protein [Fimbriimonas sp.]|nr:glycosyltransferase family 2 protein [Fimbriimonas sp.]